MDEYNAQNNEQKPKQPELTSEMASEILSAARQTVTEMSDELAQSLQDMCDVICETGYEPLVNWYNDVVLDIAGFSCGGALGITYTSIIASDAPDEERHTAQKLDSSLPDVITGISSVGSDIPRADVRCALQVSDNVFNEINRVGSYFFSIDYYAPSIDAGVPGKFLTPANDYLQGMVTEMSYTIAAPAYKDLCDIQNTFDNAMRAIHNIGGMTGGLLSTELLTYN